MSNDTIAKFPRQKLSVTAKNKPWRKQHLEWADKHSKLYNSRIRKSYISKVINYDLYAGRLHMSDMKSLLNVHNKKTEYIPKEIQHYPIVNNAIDLLVGEESNRKVKLTARIVNEDAVSTIEEKKMQTIREYLLQYLNSEQETPQQAQQEAQRLQEYLAYNIQDLEEINDNYVLQHYMREVDFDTKLLEGLKDVTLSNEEVYYFDIVANEPVMERLHPKKVFAFRTSNSNRLEDADVLLIDDYWSPGKIIDRWFEDLTEADQKELEDYSNNDSTDATIDPYEGYVDFSDIADDIESMLIPTQTIEGVDSFLYSSGFASSNYRDRDGNIRVLRILWKSKRKVLKVKSYDPETGEEDYNWRSESYKINKELGEEATVHWINEWWEATKIGKNIYLNMRPKKQQFRRLSNPSICSSGVVGQVYNSIESKSYPIIDRMKPYQYLYDIIHNTTLKLLTNHIGKVLEVDTAKIPKGWKPDKWLHFLRTENIAFVDSFKENMKGQMIGAMNNGSGKPLDLDLGNSIQLYIDLLEYLRRTMYEIVGLTPQRLGETSSRETVGGIERSVTQSSHVTAELFSIHDNVKKRCAEMLLETAKLALKNNKKKLAFVTDDNISLILDIDGDSLMSRDHGIFIENELDLGGIRQKIEQLAHAWSQNESVTPATILKIISDPSLTSIQRRIEKDISAKQEREQQNAQEQLEAQKEMQARAEQIEQLRMDFERYKIESDQELEKYKVDATIQKDIEVALIRANSTNTDDNSNGIEDGMEREKLQVQLDKIRKDYELKSKAVEETIRHNKATETIQKNKPTPSKK